jgi:hypothetical protein
LTGNLTCFQSKGFFAPLNGFFSFCKHLCFPKRPFGLSHGGPIAADPDILFSGAGVRAPRFR